MGRTTIQLFLNRLLANYFTVYVKLFRYQHYIKGAHFQPYQIFFTSLQKELGDTIHKLASYITSINGRPFCTMEKFLQEKTIEEATADDELHEMFAQLVHDFTKMKREIIHHGLKEVDECKDMMTKHFLMDHLIQLQHHISTCLTYEK